MIVLPPSHRSGKDGDHFRLVRILIWNHVLYDEKIGSSTFGVGIAV